MSPAPALVGSDCREGGFRRGFNYVLDELMDVVESLSRCPERGSYPKELVGLGIKEYRQTFFKPYRVIYRVTGSQVIIYLIADGRRDMQSVLVRRLLGA